jgi:hypothetical protein
MSLSSSMSVVDSNGGLRRKRVGLHIGNTRSILFFQQMTILDATGY